MGSKTNQAFTFQQVLEVVGALSLEDQEILLDVLQKRLRQQRRNQLVKEVMEVKQDYEDGKVQFGSVEDFLAELDS